jgi:hypothetical protein
VKVNAKPFSELQFLSFKQLVKQVCRPLYANQPWLLWRFRSHLCRITQSTINRLLGLNISNFTFCWPCIMLWFLVNDQRDTQFFTVYLFLFLTLYIFRAHHQERQIVSTQTLVTVGGRVVCRSEDLHMTQPPTQIDSYQRLCWHNLSLLMMSTMCSKHVDS